MKSKAIQNLTLSALICGLSIIFFILGMFIPFLSLLTIIGIPFATVIVYLKTDLKYSLIYIISTTLIAILINFQDAIFYITPALLTGLLFATLIKKETHSFICLIITSISSLILQLIAIEMINVIYSIDFIETLAIFFNTTIDKINSIKFILFFLIGLIQNILVFLLLKTELPKFNFNTKDDYSLFYPLLIISFTCSLIGIVLNDVVNPLSYLLTGISLLAVINLIFYYFKANRKWLTPILIFIIVLDFFLFIFLNEYLNTYGYYLFFNIITLSLSLIGVILIIDVTLLNKLCLTNDFFLESNKEVEE